MDGIGITPREPGSGVFCYVGAAAHGPGTGRLGR